MDLLQDRFVPVYGQGCFQHIGLETLLTEDANWQIGLPRDDMELACLQLLVCLVQGLLPPKDREELKQCIATPLAPETYRQAIAEKADWFRLDHSEHPFMQTRGVKAKELTGMDKLFAGLSSATSSCFVNEPGLANLLCPSCTAIGLFNQASNCPSFGGGFKGSLRGGAPITTLVQGESLRQTLWRNVLPEDSLERLMPWHSQTREARPNWVDTVKAGDTVHAHQTGLLRGLLWQPAHVELGPPEGKGVCDCCGQTADRRYVGFKKEKFVYDFKGIWPHPHAPRHWKLSKGEREERFASFTTTAPAWTQLSQFIIEKQAAKEGQTPAPVVGQAQAMAQGAPLHLLVGGYRNNQAAILERRHELFNIAKEWEDHYDQIERVVDTALMYKTQLRNKLFGFFKASGVNLYDQAETQFYRQSESLIHGLLRDMNFRQSKVAFAVFGSQLEDAARGIFNDLTEPYRQVPKMLKALALACRGLEKAFIDLRQ